MGVNSVNIASSLISCPERTKESIEFFSDSKTTNVHGSEFSLEKKNKNKNNEKIGENEVRLWGHEPYNSL